MNSGKRWLRTVGTAAAVAIVALAGLVVAAAPAQAACTFATYAPNKEGSNVKGWAEKWGCGGSVQWTLTLQRHRTSIWWQNEAQNFSTGDGWMSAQAGCASGTWTYRTVLDSNVGHHAVSANKVITC